MGDFFAGIVKTCYVKVYLDFFFQSASRHFRIEKETGSSYLSQRLLGMLGGTELTNWPIAEWRVPTNDPGSLFEVATCYELMVT